MRDEDFQSLVDYMPFVEVDADEIRQLLADVRTLVNGIAKHIADKS